MMKIIRIILLALAVAAPALTTPPTASAASRDSAATLAPQIAKVGERAPDFTLDALVATTPGKEFGKIALKELNGKWVVLFF